MSQKPNNIPSPILKIELLKVYKPERVVKIQYGLANEVYRLDFKNKKLILKIYRELAKSDISDFLISRCTQNGILTAKTLDSGLCLGKKYVLTNFIDGKHIYSPGDREITQIIDLVIKTPTFYTQQGYRFTIYDKINNYYNDVKKISKTKLPHTIVNNVIKMYESRLKKTCTSSYFVVHGDISPTNLLWTKHGDIYLLDFDEAILAPAEYDLIVAVVKFSKRGPFFDIKLARKMIEKYTKLDRMHKMNELSNVWDLYILKVLLEKIYLHETGAIDLYSKEQMVDNWLNWYNLLTDKDIRQQLFSITRSLSYVSSRKFLYRTSQITEPQRRASLTSNYRNTFTL